VANNNSWSRPPAPPPKLFTGRKELDFVKQINTELEERVIGEEILYFPLDIQRSNYHQVYGEAIRKVYLPPVHVYCLVEWLGVTTDQKNGIIDRQDNIVVHFHNRRLVKDQELWVQEGDALLYGNTYFEIQELNFPTQIFGYAEVEFKVEISAKCSCMRRGEFNG
jgi:hypothetical protein